MTDDKDLVRREVTAGDASVDGLLAGLVAGIAMAAYLIAAALVSGEAIVQVLGRFSAREVVSPVVGALSHLATSAIYGALFGVLSRPLRGRLPAWLSGVAYGALVYLAGRFIILPGTDSPLQALAAVHFGIAHVVYGFVLGLLLQRRAGPSASTLR